MCEHSILTHRGSGLVTVGVVVGTDDGSSFPVWETVESVSNEFGPDA
jgi:hypothetical protein